MFSTLPKTNFNFSVTLILSSASDFNLDLSKNLTFGKGIIKDFYYSEFQEMIDVVANSKGMSEEELAERKQALKRDQKVIFVSLYLYK